MTKKLINSVPNTVSANVCGDTIIVDVGVVAHHPSHSHADHVHVHVAVGVVEHILVVVVLVILVVVVVIIIVVVVDIIHNVTNNGCSQNSTC